ncbi:hypothetical protein M8009_02370 [Halomonas sp. ATCH28]|uniref:Uncharacterized protein n=1 Tax=Halomonas gemina TaxID=2945105 RepID=A0ABT0SWY1_9GAMM|nr:hypothetical protein [Halomonas gemina]MCL7939151.1 hypothetical protein [Halomonas gemina]
MNARREKLLEVIQGWRRPRPEDPESLASALDLECSILERLPPRPDMSRGEWIEAVERFRAGIEHARQAFEGLPPSARTMLGQHLALGDMAGAGASGLSAGPMEWPPLEELLEALHEAAGNLVEDAPAQYARPRPELTLIAVAVRVCKRHGVRVSAASGGRFLKVLEVIIPERADHRGLMRQAMKMGVISPPDR